MKSEDVRVCGVTANSEPAGGGGRSEANYIVTELRAENTRLKKLNREMVEAINDLLWHVDGYDQFKDPIYDLLTKAKEEEGE